MRKITAFLTSLVICALVVGPTSAPVAGAKDTPRLCIQASFLPVYIFTHNLIQGVPGTSVELMLPPGAGCPHDYTLTIGDLKKLAASDAIVINGLGLEEFVERSVRVANPDIKVIDSSRGMAALETRETREDHGRINAHVWMSPALAVRQVKNIAEGLAAIDPVHAGSYRKNAAYYTSRLENLIIEFKRTAAVLKKRRVVTSHDVFGYLARDLGLTVVVSIQEAHGRYPSAGRLKKLIRAIKEEKVAAIFAESQYPLRLAQILSSESGVPFYILDPLTTAQGAAGLDYYEKVMHNNLAIIRKALGETN